MRFLQLLVVVPLLAGCSLLTVAEQPSDTARGPSLSDVTAELTCAGARGDLAVTWTAGDATGVAITWDGATVAAGLPPATGEESLPVPCDGRGHLLAVEASDDFGSAAAVTLALPASGGEG